MPSVEALCSTLQRLFTTTAERVAHSTRAIDRPTGKFDGATLCQTLVFGVLEKPQPTLATWCQTAASLGVEVSVQAIDQRLNERTARFLEELLSEAIRQAIAADPVLLDLLQRFPGGVWLQDCSQVVLPAALVDYWEGCGDSTKDGHTAVVKLAVRLELCTGTLQGPALVSARVHDRVACAELPDLPTGCLVIIDLGFFSTTAFAALTRTDRYWLSRLQAGTSVFTADGKRWVLSELLAAQNSTTIDLPVEIGKKERLSCRLIAVRVPEAVANARRRRMRDEARRRGQMVSEERLKLADWTVLVTNVAADQLSVSEALVLARSRWQIERLFKRWKSGGGQIDQWRTEDPEKLRCEFFAKLLAMVVEHWLLVTGCWHLPDRSLDRAAGAVRAFAAALVCTLRDTERLRATVRDVLARCQAKCRVARRKADPAAFELIHDPSILEELWDVA